MLAGNYGHHGEYLESAALYLLHGYRVSQSRVETSDLQKSESDDESGGCHESRYLNGSHGYGVLSTLDAGGGYHESHVRDETRSYDKTRGYDEVHGCEGNLRFQGSQSPESRDWHENVYQNAFHGYHHGLSSVSDAAHHGRGVCSKTIVGLPLHTRSPPATSEDPATGLESMTKKLWSCG